jgi:hypothetical protein
MSDLIPNAPTQKIGGHGSKIAFRPSAKKVAKGNISSHKKTAFQRKAT